jgi:hypothetical protein
MPFQINQACTAITQYNILNEEDHLSTGLYEIIDDVQFAKETDCSYNYSCDRLDVFAPSFRLHLFCTIQRESSGMTRRGLEFSGGAISDLFLQILMPCRRTVVTDSISFARALCDQRASGFKYSSSPLPSLMDSVSIVLPPSMLT